MAFIRRTLGLGGGADKETGGIDYHKLERLSGNSPETIAGRDPPHPAPAHSSAVCHTDDAIEILSLKPYN